MEDDSVIDFMKEHGISLTRENYLEVAYMGTPPAELDAEAEAALPPQFRRFATSEITRNGSARLGRKAEG